MNTGRADMYSPFTGLISGQQLLPSESQFNIQIPTGFDMNLTQGGTVEGNGAKNLLTSFAKGVGKGIGTTITEFIISGISDDGGYGVW